MDADNIAAIGYAVAAGLFLVLTALLLSRWRNRFVGSLYVAFGVTDDLTLRVGVNHMASPFNDAL